MTKPFPNDPFLTGYYAPSGVECDAPDLVIEGELPGDLVGTYYRNGPAGHYYVPRRDCGARSRTGSKKHSLGRAGVQKSRKNWRDFRILLKFIV